MQFSKICGSRTFQDPTICDEYHLADLRVFENCLKVCNGADHVFNLAADMGGISYIKSNNARILFNNTKIAFNMLEAARQSGVHRCGTVPRIALINTLVAFVRKFIKIYRIFYASSACVYANNIDMAETGLKEADAWPALVSMCVSWSKCV